MKSKALRHLIPLLLLCFSSFSSLYSVDPQDEHLVENTQLEKPIIPSETDSGYTINFNNVSILEYIKFISKIANVNFIYNEAELQFNVSILSEESTSLVNVMAALVQVLKMNGFGIIEQGNNLLISRTGAVRQIATVVSQENPLEGPSIPAIMTRVFKIKNANPSALASLLVPLLSTDAILEVSAETRHIIITDITQNIEQIQKLLLSLDSPKSPLNIDSYVTQNNSPETLISLANQIIIPISEGNPVIFVPQNQTSTIFIVSTPFLIEKAIMILEDLDHPPTLTKRLTGPITGKNILLYHILNKPADVLQTAIKQLESNLAQMGPSSQDLVQTLSTMRYIRESHSLLFMGDPQSLKEVQKILSQLDVPYTETELEFTQGGFYIYKIKYGNEEQIARSLEKLTENLKKSPYPDRDLISTIDSIKWIKENNSLLFTGDQHSINKLKQILPAFDTPSHEGKTSSKLPLSNDFYTYYPKYLSGEELFKQIQDTYKTLQISGLADPAFLHALNSAKWVPSTHHLIFTGDPQSLDRIRILVASIDQPKGPPKEETTVYVYKVKYVNPSYIDDALQKLAKSLSKDDPVVITIDHAKYIKEANSFAFQGPVTAINRIKEILSILDTEAVAAEESAERPAYFVYKLQYALGSFVIKELDETAKTLKSSDVQEKHLIDAIHDITWNKGTNSLVLIGPRDTLDKLKLMIAKYDVPTTAKATQFYLYKPVSMPADEFQKTAINAAQDLQNSGLHDPFLISALKSARVTADGNAVMFTGTPEAIDKLRVMIPDLDHHRESQKANKIYLYTPLNRSANEIIKATDQAANRLKDTSISDPNLIEALKSGKVFANGKSVLFVGTPAAVEQLQEIVPTLDTEKPNATQFYVYKPQVISAEELEKRSVEAAEKFMSSGLKDPELIEALKNAKVNTSKDAVTYVGTPEAIDRIKTLVPTYDSGQRPEQTTQFYVYKPVNMSAEELRSRMLDVANSFKDSGLADPNLITALTSAQLTSGGKAVLFTGTPQAIESIKAMVSKYDLHQEKPQAATEFFVYKPQHISADDLRRHARMVAQDMENSGLADTYLINTLANTKLVSNGTAVLFTGTPEAIVKVKELLPSLDQLKEQPKTIGKTTFLIYKIKHVQGPILMGYLRNMATDLQRARSTETGLIDTLNNMRYVKETNSIIFTGTSEILQRAQAIAEQFDTVDLATEPVLRVPTGFLIYKPKYVPGQQLIIILKDFEQNLLQSGVSDPNLFDTINNLKWMEQVSSILISGDDDVTKKVYSLLERFDVPGPGIAKEETGIESISDMSFLIYKLQYHSGAEIQMALQKIGDDLVHLKPDKTNQGLIEAIKALQWIEVTNSLISTGQSNSLAKLKELIKSIDIPLKQVFVEILIIETDISNSLNFGLRWASQGVYREKFAYGTGAFPQAPSSGTDPLSLFDTSLQSVTATNTPTGQMIPFSSGFDLGVIGDIILHKGKSYFALGSLIDAIRGDSDSTVALNQKIITQDNKNATTFVGQNIPYTGSIVNNQGSNTVTSSNLEYRDVGVSLSITPQVGNNDTVTLNINQEITEDISSSTTGSDSGSGGLTGITTSKTTTQTSVTVPNKSFLIISGQIDNSVVRTRTSIPCLGGLPLIGAAFSQNDALTESRAVIVFVRPHIIKSFDVYKEITQNQEDLHRAQTEDDEAFDAGLELVKTPDDY